MNIAIFGATSQIAKDLIVSFANKTSFNCTLFARNPTLVEEWKANVNLPGDYCVLSYKHFDKTTRYDVIINFIGIGNPALAKDMGASIFDVTLEYDTIVLDYIKSNPDSQYIFLSSGAAYGGDFKEAVAINTPAIFNINSMTSASWYGVAKFYAEARHRALPRFSIVDIRVFNYFSSTQNLGDRFLITDLVRAIYNNESFITTAENLVRDFITPEDFFGMVMAVLGKTNVNLAIDCYTKSPVDKYTLLSEFSKRYGLKVSIIENHAHINATGIKVNYFSRNKIASGFGYSPKFSSLEGLVYQLDKILSVEG